MDLNALADSIYDVIEAKGFHGIEHEPIEAITFRQILHLLTEWGEMYAWYKKHGLPMQNQKEVLGQLYEEGADILIVAMDLAKLHDIDLSPLEEEIERPVYGNKEHIMTTIPRQIGILGNVYRKNYYVLEAVLFEMMQNVYAIIVRHGGDPIAEVMKKMDINEKREERYGIGA